MELRLPERSKPWPWRLPMPSPKPIKSDRREAIAEFHQLRSPHAEEQRVTRLLRAGLNSALEPCTQPLLVGAVGLGKTDLAARTVARFVAEQGRNAAAYVNVPPAAMKGQAYDMRPVCRQILNSLGRPTHLIDAVSSARWENERVEQALIDTTQQELRLRQPGVLTLDEMERLLPRGRVDEHPLDTVAWWADRAQVPILGIGNYDAVMSMNGSSKLFRRQLVIHYQPYEGRDGFRKYLEGMLPLVQFFRAAHLGASSIDWDEVCRALFMASHGRLGESKRVLSYALELSGEQELSRGDIEESIEAKLSQRTRMKFAKDLEVGRQRLAAAESANDEIPARQRRAPAKTGRIGRKAAIVETGLVARA